MLPQRNRPRWGRVRAPGAAVLRRGAWYPVVSTNIPKRIVLDTGDREVALHKDLVDLREDRPARFSVVQKTDTDRNPAAGTPWDIGLEYAVCPMCRERVDAPQADATLECTACYYRGQIDWDHPC
jgi:hypothetical protein